AHSRTSSEVSQGCSTSSSALVIKSAVTSTVLQTGTYLEPETRMSYWPLATRTLAIPLSSVTARYGCMTTRAPLIGVCFSLSTALTETSQSGAPTTRTIMGNEPAACGSSASPPALFASH